MVSITTQWLVSKLRRLKWEGEEAVRSCRKQQRTSNRITAQQFVQRGKVGVNSWKRTDGTRASERITERKKAHAKKERTKHTQKSYTIFPGRGAFAGKTLDAAVERWGR
jgi:hypothetical protein